MVWRQVEVSICRLDESDLAKRDYVRKTIISVTIASVFGLLAPQTLTAQGTTYLSNLEQPSIGGLAVGSNSWA